LALGLLRQRACGRRRADRRPALRARDKGSGRPPPGRSRRRAAGRLAGRHRLPAAGGPPARLARLDLAAARRWPGRPGLARRPRGQAEQAPAIRAAGRVAAARRAVPHPCVCGRTEHPALLLRRHAGLLLGVRAMAAGRPALLAAEGRPDRRGVQRRQLPRRAHRGAARAAPRSARLGRRRRPDGRRYRRRGPGRPRTSA